MREILTFGKYYKKLLNKKVRKIPISISGFTCPNIDGTVAKGGCTYCLNESFSPNLNSEKNKFYLNLNTKENIILNKQIRELKEQFKETREYFKKRDKSEKFIVYFQSFTNTYADIQTLKTLYELALSFDDVIGLSIGTRADSINGEILDYLNKLGEDKEIWIEYGVQTIYNETLDKINRGESIELVETIIKETKKRQNLKICTHLIFGLPNESNEMMIDSVKKVIAWNIDSIKIHPCYVVKNTALAVDLKRKKFTPISEDSYIKNLVDSLKLTPNNIVIQRVTAGIDDDSLLAPLWCKDKNSNFQKIKNALKKVNLNY